MSQLPALIGVFAYLSLLTVGGGLAAFPELKTLVVDVHHWMDFDALIHLASGTTRASRASALRPPRRPPWCPQPGRSFAMSSAASP